MQRLLLVYQPVLNLYIPGKNIPPCIGALYSSIYIVPQGTFCAVYYTGPTSLKTRHYTDKNGGREEMGPSSPLSYDDKNAGIPAIIFCLLLLAAAQ